MLNRPDLDADRRTQAIRDLGEFGSECLHTLVSRIMDPSTSNYYRRVVGLYIDKDEVPRLVRDASGNAAAWASGLEDALTDKRVTVKPGATPKGAIRLAGHELVQNRRGVDPLLLLDDVFSELDPHRSDRLLNLLPTGQTLVTTASPLPAGMSPAAVIDLTELVS